MDTYAIWVLLLNVVLVATIVLSILAYWFPKDTTHIDTNTTKHQAVTVDNISTGTLTIQKSSSISTLLSSNLTIQISLDDYFDQNNTWVLVSGGYIYQLGRWVLCNAIVRFAEHVQESFLSVKNPAYLPHKQTTGILGSGSVTLFPDGQIQPSVQIPEEWVSTPSSLRNLLFMYQLED